MSVTTKTQSSLKAKLMMLVGVSFLRLTGLAAYSTYTVIQMGNTVSFLGNQRIPIATSIGDIRADINAVARFMWLTMAQKPGSEERSKSIKKATEALARLPQSLEQISSYQLTDKARAQITEISEILPKLEPVILGVVKLVEAGQDERAKFKLISEMPPIAVPLTEKIVNLAAQITERNKVIIADSEKNAQTAKFVMVVASVVLGFSIGVFGFIFATRLSRTLGTISKLIEDSSKQVAAAAYQVSSASHELSSTSAEQASAVEETSASLEEISGMVENNVRSAENGASSAEEMMKATEVGSMSMQELDFAMGQISDSNKRIEGLVKIINEIGEKTEVIDEIVFQTKLLSFNASVEAERAGEHGRGFAVVAQEVGSLAQMSGKAALEIASIVKTSVKEAQEIYQENKARVEKGNDCAKSTAKSFDQIKTSMEHVRTGSNQILTASKEQSAGIKQINTAISNINKATQETAATSEEAASAGEELSAQSRHLDALVSDLSQIVTGKIKVETNPENSEATYKPETTKNAGKVINLGQYKMAKAPKETNVEPADNDAASKTGTDGWDKL